MELTCIVCPMGCRVTVEEVDGKLAVSGQGCKRGEAYAIQETTRPMRALTSLVSLSGGAEPLLPVKTSGSIPKSAIEAALSELRGISAAAPVKIGDIVIHNIAGTGVNLVAAANRRRA